MKKLHCLFASAVIVVAGCADEEATVSRGNTGQAVVQESAGMVGTVVAEIPAEPVNEAVLSEIVAAEAENSATAEISEPVADALDDAMQGVSDGVVAAPAGAVATKPEGGAPSTAATGVAAVDLEQGREIYSGSCFACHAAGVAGAPKLGDAANWAPRVAQGVEVMAAHAINGFKGTSGYMPAKGGAGNLTDEEVTAAVAYMVSASR